MRKQYKNGDIIGINGITYIEEGRSIRKIRYATFKCHCSKLFYSRISAVKSGHTTSCGCHKLKIFIERNTIHGMYGSHLYIIWGDIRERTKNSSNNYNYGGRGIVMFPPWREDFSLFYDYVSSLPSFNEKGMTLDRIDVNGNYEPGNLRWTTKHVQGANRRMMPSNTSGYTGVGKDGNMWYARIKIMQKIICIGSYKTKEQAVTARNEYIIKNQLFEYPIQEPQTQDK